MIELQVDAQRGAQIGVPVRQHVDALDRGDRLHVLQACERLDRWTDDDVLVGPGAIRGVVGGAIAFVPRMGPHAGEPAVPERRILGLLHDRTGFFRVVHPGDLDAHDALVQQERNRMDERLGDTDDR